MQEGALKKQAPFLSILRKGLIHSSIKLT